MVWELAEGGPLSDTIWAWTGKVVLDMSLKVMQCRRIDAELPLQVQAHLLKCKHPLTNNTP